MRLNISLIFFLIFLHFLYKFVDRSPNFSTFIIHVSSCKMSAYIAPMLQCNFLPKTFCFQLVQKLQQYNVKYCQETPHLPILRKCFTNVSLKYFLGTLKFSGSHGPIHFPPLHKPSNREIRKFWKKEFLSKWKRHN